MMDPLIYYLLIFLIGFVAAIVGSIAAGAGLITFPLLILLGISPYIALASSKLAGLGFRLGGFINYFKHKKIVWSLVLPLSIIGIIGGIIGAKLLVNFDPDLLGKVVGIILLVLLPFLLLRKNVGTVQKTISKSRLWLAHSLYFLQRIWEGFFNPGAGFINQYIGLNAYGMTILKWKGTTRIPAFISDLAAITVFAIAAIIDYKIGIVMFFGMLIGSYIGTNIAIKKGDAWLKPLMAVLIVISSIKLIFF